MFDQDTKIKRTGDLKNDLETYIYDMMGKIDSGGELSKYISREKKEEFDQVLQEKDEWLNSEGYDSNFEKYEQHLNDLKAYGDPLKKRDEELKKKTCFNQYLNKYNKWV